MSSRSLRRHSRRSLARTRAPQKGNNGNGNGNGPPDTAQGASEAPGKSNGHGHAFGGGNGNTNSPDTSTEPPPPPPSESNAPDPNAGGGTNGGTGSSSDGNTAGNTGGNTAANSGSTPPDRVTSTSHSETSSSSSVNAQISGTTTGIPSVSAAVISGGDSSTVPTLASPSFPNPSASSSSEVTSAAALSHRSNSGAIAGGVVGAILFFALAFGAWIVYKRRRKNRTAPSAQFLSNPVYPFAQGFGAIAYRDSEKSKPHGGNYGGAGTGAAGNANFRSFNSISSENIFSDPKPQMEQYMDERPVPPGVPLSPLPQPEVLYSTRPPGTPPPPIPTSGSMPGTPTTPGGRRIPFGTGTFQFPPRPPQPQQSTPPQPL